jgi:hypothetical protein
VKKVVLGVRDAEHRHDDQDKQENPALSHGALPTDDVGISAPGRQP